MIYRIRQFLRNSSYVCHSMVNVVYQDSERKDLFHGFVGTTYQCSIIMDIEGQKSPRMGRYNFSGNQLRKIMKNKSYKIINNY